MQIRHQIHVHYGRGDAVVCMLLQLHKRSHKTPCRRDILRCHINHNEEAFTGHGRLLYRRDENPGGCQQV